MTSVNWCWTLFETACKTGDMIGVIQTDSSQLFVEHFFYKKKNSQEMCLVILGSNIHYFF